jgi:hypothetical protein
MAKFGRLDRSFLRVVEAMQEGLYGYATWRGGAAFSRWYRRFPGTRTVTQFANAFCSLA